MLRGIGVELKLFSPKATLYYARKITEEKKNTEQRWQQALCLYRNSILNIIPSEHSCMPGVVQRATGSLFWPCVGCVLCWPWPNCHSLDFYRKNPITDFTITLK